MPVIGNRQPYRPLAPRHRDRAPCRPAVPQYIRRRLPDHPAEQGLGPRRERRSGAVHRHRDARRRQRRARPVEVGGQAALPVPRHRLADLGQRLASHRLDVRDLRDGRVHVGAGQPAGGLGLHDDHGQGVAEEVVQVAGEAQAFLLDRAPGEFLAGGAQVAYRVGEGEDRRRDHRGDRRGVRRVQAAPAVLDDTDHPGERHPYRRARGQSEQREEQQPGAAVAEAQGAGHRGQQD